MGVKKEIQCGMSMRRKAEVNKNKSCERPESGKDSMDLSKKKQTA